MTDGGTAFSMSTRNGPMADEPKEKKYMYLIKISSSTVKSGQKEKKNNSCLTARKGWGSDPRITHISRTTFNCSFEIKPACRVGRKLNSNSVYLQNNVLIIYIERERGDWWKKNPIKVASTSETFIISCRGCVLLRFTYLFSLVSDSVCVV